MDEVAMKNEFDLNFAVQGKKMENKAENGPRLHHLFSVVETRNPPHLFIPQPAHHHCT
jgi:hypothetical protein